MRDPESTNFFFHRELFYTEEKVWKAHYHWLQQQGYQLRERYSPAWKPDWSKGEIHTKARDGEPVGEEVLNRLGMGLHCQVVDAIRISDGRQVAIKGLDTAGSPTELELTAYFSPSAAGSGRGYNTGYGYDLRGKKQYNLDPSDCARVKSDPRNHCPELLDVLYPPQDHHERHDRASNANINDDANDDMLVFL
ncbi:hypothetical protein CVT24_010988, partial [Panaeolus cyanescens]